VGLTGTKYGCGVAQCGACAVHINGEVQRSCSIAVKDMKPTDRVVTIEGLSPDGSHAVQKAWLALDVPQCGYCQAGQLMTAAALIAKKPKPTDADIDEAMTNICRCGTYQRIRAAIHMAAGNNEDSKQDPPLPAHISRLRRSRRRRTGARLPYSGHQGRDRAAIDRRAGQ
jgi:isoquinoline 1-oxidoreductase alpha subunit